MASRPVGAGMLALVCAAAVACTARYPDTPESTGTGRARAEEAAPAGSVTTGDAVATAVRFVCSGQRLLDTPPSELAGTVHSMWSAAAADEALARALDRLAGLRDRLGSGVGRTRFRQAVLAVRVESSSEDRVVVSMWWVGVLSRADAAIPQAQWSTSTVTMVLESGEWKVAAETTEAGPTPDHSLDAEPIGHDELERRLAGFEDRGDR